MEAQRIVPWILYLLYLIASVWLTRLHIALPCGLGRLSLFWKGWCIWMTVHFLFIQPIVDFDQAVNPAPQPEFGEPELAWWPPHEFRQLIQWYSRNFDPLVLARPGWWVATVAASDVLQTWAGVAVMVQMLEVGVDKTISSLRFSNLLVYSMTSVLVNTSTVCVQEFWPYETDIRYKARDPLTVFLLNIPWLMFPFCALWNVLLRAYPEDAVAVAVAPSTVKRPTSVKKLS